MPWCQSQDTPIALTPAANDEGRLPSSQDTPIALEPNSLRFVASKVVVVLFCLIVADAAEKASDCTNDNDDYGDGDDGDHDDGDANSDGNAFSGCDNEDTCI